MITRASVYAMRALCQMAKDPNKSHPGHSLFAAAGVPAAFGGKVMGLLCTACLIESARGPRGGYSFLWSPDQISLLDVVEACDGPIRFVDPLCPCPADADLDIARQLCEETLAASTIADLLVRAAV